MDVHAVRISSRGFTFLLGGLLFLEGGLCSLVFGTVHVVQILVKDGNWMGWVVVEMVKATE